MMITRHCDLATKERIYLFWIRSSLAIIVLAIFVLLHGSKLISWN